MSTNSDHSLNTSNKNKTADVKITQNIKFEGMLLSETVCKGLHENNYISPSPIQLKSIPLGKCGFDMLMQAKSGTGKTLAFGILALELINENPKGLRVLILSPTREIAVQINEVLTNVGKYIENFKSHYFIGGLSVGEDIKKLIKCNIAVGAPGRVNQLIKENRLKTKDISLFVLDEADKLMNESYIDDIKFIYSKLPKEKQVIASSATYFEELDDIVTKFMRSHLVVTPQTDIPVLLGVKQFVSVIKRHENVMRQLQIKTEELTHIFSSIPFKQCLVFSNYQTRAESLSYTLTNLGWPTDFISGLLQQSERMEKIKNFKEFKFRILISTDLTARGIDVENINLVINFDVPNNAATYLHRIGRAGRYGTEGISITLVDDGKDTSDFKSLLDDIDKELLISILPKKVPENIWKLKCNDFETYHGSKEKYSSVVETSNVIEEMEEKNDTIITEDNEDIKNSNYGIPMLKSEVIDDVVKKNTCLLELGKIFVKNKKVMKMDPFETYMEKVNNDCNDVLKCVPENNPVFNITDNTINLIEHLLKLIEKDLTESSDRIKNDCKNLSCNDITQRLLAGEVLNTDNISLNLASKNIHVKNFATIEIKGNNENECKNVNCNNTDNVILNSAPKNVHVKNFATIEIKSNNESRVSKCKKKSLQHNNVDCLENNVQPSNSFNNYCTRSENNLSNFDWYDLWQDQLSSIHEYVRKCKY